MKLLHPGVNLLLILLLSVSLTFQVRAAAIKTDPVPLSAVLKQLSDIYSVNFLYEETNISGKAVIFDVKNVKGKNLELILTDVLHPLGLAWIKIDIKNYSIVKLQDDRNSADPADRHHFPGLIGTDTVAAGQLPQADFVAGGQTLKEVKIVTSSPLLQKKNDRYVFNVEKSIIGEGATVAELVDKLPGVQLDKDGKITINGKSGVSVFIDGKPTLLSLDGILSSGIERIELINNPSAKFESAGSGGIINVIRRKNRKDGLNGVAALGYGRGKYDRYNGSFNIGFKNDRFSLLLNNAAMSEKTYINADALSVFFDGTQKTGTLDAQNFHIRTQKTFVPDVGLELYLSPVTTLTLSANGQIRNYRQRSDSFTDLLDQNDLKTANLGFVNNERDPMRNYSSGAHLVHQIDTNGREFTADLDYSRYNNRSDQYIDNSSNDAAGNFIERTSLFLDQENRLNIYSAKADYVHPLTGNSKLEMGIKSSYVDSRSTSDFYDLLEGKQMADLARSNNFKYEENINAAYLLYSGVVKDISYQAGLRFEQTDGRGNQLLTNQLFKQNYARLFPSFTIKYQLDSRNSIKLSSGRKIDRPAYQDLNPLLSFVNSTAYIQGDPNLKPQMAYNNEISYAYNNTFFLTLGSSFYSHYMTYWVFPELDPKDNTVDVVVSRPVNIDRASSYTLNAVVLKKINQWWATNNSFTAFYAGYKGVINNYRINNEGMLSFMFSTSHTVSITDRVAAEANFRYAGKLQIGSSIYLPNSNLSLGIKTSLLAERASLTFNVTDVFHRQNYRWTSSTGSILETRDVRIDSRVYKLNFSYRFGKAGAKRMNTSNSAEEEKNRARTN